MLAAKLFRPLQLNPTWNIVGIRMATTMTRSVDLSCRHTLEVFRPPQFHDMTVVVNYTEMWRCKGGFSSRDATKMYQTLNPLDVQLGICVSLIIHLPIAINEITKKTISYEQDWYFANLTLSLTLIAGSFTWIAAISWCISENGDKSKKE